MAWRAAAAAQLLLGLLGLFPRRLSGVGAQVTQGFQLRQPQDKVSVAIGETLTLTCTTSREGPVGPVKWLKGWGSGNQTVYDQTGTFPRVTRAVDRSDTDFTIHISDVQFEDAGTYYCVKFERRLHGPEVFQHGKGTEVSVQEKTQVSGIVAATVVFGSLLLLLLLLFVALCMYRRKHRGDVESQCLARPAAMGCFSPLSLRCCVGTPSTPSSEVLDAESSHLPSQQSGKEDNYIHYADLQPLPVAPRHIRSPDAACSEYASVRVAAK